jgi:hypothetical protein
MTTILVNNGGTVGGRKTTSLWGGMQTGISVNQSHLNLFGVGGTSSTSSAGSGTSGVVMLFYSAPNCNALS